jgi:chemotaxis protein methyltransferase CheR
MSISELELELFVNAVKECSTYDFSDYSDKSLKRRIDRLLVEYKVNLSGLIFKIKKDNAFLEQIVKDITVNTTELFRDPEAWHEIRQRVINKVKDKPSINIWHAGCSTGQEVYSLAIMLNEMGIFDKCNIYASDLNIDVLEFAQRGEYKYRFNLNYLSNFDQVLKEDPYNYTAVKEVDYSTYFTIDKKNDKIMMKDFLKEKPFFKKMDLVKMNNSFMKSFDIILCRNVLIYFNLNLQNKVIDFFHQNLNEKGFLILGKHESLLGYPENNFDKKGKFYQKK